MSVKVTRLANGLTVATDAMAGVESATVGVWVGAGARHEPAEVNGIAHLLEHMAFKGTERRSALAIAEEIEAVGGYLNAYTTREHTADYARVLAGDVPIAVDILADILQHSTFDPAELERERAVILQEIGQAEDTPDDIIFDHLQLTAFPEQALGRPILGSPEIVRRLDREAVRSYMRTRYGASSMILVGAGRVEHEALVRLAERHFAQLPAKADLAREPAAFVGGERRDQKELEQVHLVLGFAGLPHTDPDYYAASVYSTLIGGGMSSRLFQEVREKRGLVYSVYSFTNSYFDGGLFGIYAGTGEAQAAETLRVIADELARARDDVTEEELNRARAQVKAGLLMGRESTGARAEQLAQQLMIFGRPLPVAEIVAELEAVDRARIALMAERLTSSPPAFAALGPIDGLGPLGELARALS
ncbi:MAG TPA: pitrilysin family protein [Alphaproteobacteria bacterium]